MINETHRQQIEQRLAATQLAQSFAEVRALGVPLPDAEDQQRGLLEMMASDLITPWTEVARRQFLFELKGHPIVPSRELTVVAGKAKSGKTFLSSMMLATAVTTDARRQCRMIPLVRVGEEPMRALWFDTEQSEQSSQEILTQRILPMAYLDAEMFDPCRLWVCNTCMRAWQERLYELVTAIIIQQPQLVVVDGIVDLLESINDEQQARLIICLLRWLSRRYDCAIVAVIHLNKSDNSSPRGWVGTEAINKCFELYELRRDPDRKRVLIAEQTMSRGPGLEDPFEYTVGERGLPEAEPTEFIPQGASTEPVGPVNPTIKDQRNYWKATNGQWDLKRIFECLVPEGERIRSSQLFKQVSSMLGLSASTVSRLVEFAMADKLIMKMTVSAKEVYYIRFREDLNNFELS